MIRKLVTAILLVLISISYGQLEAGSPAPSFFLRTLEGDSFYLSRKVGPKARPNEKGPLLISFFATWCIPCKAEIPRLHELQEEFPSVSFYLIDVSETQELVQEYVEQFEITLPVLMDIHGVAGKKYEVVDENNVAHLPNIFIIDAEGTIFYGHQGYRAGDETIYRQQLAALVAGEPPVEVEQAPGETHDSLAVEIEETTETKEAEVEEE